MVRKRLSFQDKQLTCLFIFVYVYVSLRRHDLVDTSAPGKHRHSELPGGAWPVGRAKVAGFI